MTITMSGESASWPSSAGRASTLPEILAARAQGTPNRRAFTFLADGEAEAGALTYGDLDRRARSIAAALTGLASSGERALLLFHPGLDFITAFWGCLYAGVVAVPASPPRPRRDQPRLLSMAADCDPALVLTSASLTGRVEGLAAEIPGLAGARRLAVDELPDCDGPGPVARAGSDPAFLQYTSGSTSAPKGVVVSHSNLFENQRMLRTAFGHDEPPVVVGWLPFHHDMGLVGNLIEPLYCGGHCVLMSPMAFLQRPQRWLAAIDRYRATTSGGPNFAYDLCVRKVPPERLDLSSWRVAFNGAEPVRVDTMERFSAAFAGCGFRPEAFYPCYGLAEATLFVSGRRPGSPLRIREVGGAARVSCGLPWLGQRLLIADPETGRVLPDGEVGEIWVSGPSVTEGYWRRPDLSAELFAARPTGAGGEARSLRTGDLGFLDGGELFVTGRLKDLVIVRGQNHYPQDLELTAERSHPALRPGGGAAFSVEVREEERLVLVHEVDRHPGVREERIAEQVRRAVTEEHEIQVHEVVLIRAGTLPKTSSGKVRRQECRALYLAGALIVVGHSALPDAAAGPAADEESTGVEGLLRRALGRVLRIDPAGLDPETPLTAAGLDSLSAIEFQELAGTELGIALPLAELLQGISLSGLSRLALPAAPAGGPEAADGAEGEPPLSWGQQALWFLHRLDPGSAAYHLAGAARLPGTSDPAALRRALQKLVDRHEALRTTFVETATGPAQRIAAKAEVDFQEEDARGLDLAGIRRRLAERAFEPFDLSRGPLFRSALFRGAPGGDLLLLAVHHAVADFWSLAVMARDLAIFLAGGEAPPLPREGSFAEFVRWQERELAVRGDELWERWRERLEGVPPVDLPVDRARLAAARHAPAVARTVRVGEGAAAALRDLARRESATLFATLLAGVQALLARYGGQERFLVGSPTAGRGAERWASTIGYFVNPVPLRADLSGDPTVEELLGRVRGVVADALELQALPFPLLVERAQPDREPDRPPLVRALFALQRSPLPGFEPLAAWALGAGGTRLELGGVALESVPLEPPAVPFDLTLMAADLEGDLALSLQLDGALFDPATADRLSRHLANLLRSMASGRGRRASDLDLLDEGERRQALVDWNATAAPLPTTTGLHELFLAQAARTPDRVAVIHGHERQTYGELVRRSLGIAARLRGLGVGPEVPVGILCERDPGLLAGLIGILAAGGAYVPLDPAHPRERLEYLLADSGAPVLLAGERLTEALPPFAGRVALLDAPAISIPQTVESPGACHGEQLAYLIYTSGSTGRPKGVAIRHAGAVAMVAWGMARYPADRLAGVLAATSVSFDLSVFEIFVPLAAGGTVILAPDALALPELPAASEVTLVNTVPSAMAELAGALPPAVRVINLAGEPLRRELANALYAVPGIEEVHNLYGPSEDTTYSTGALVPRQGGAPTIGAPLDNRRACVLDARMSPVPVGVPGDLWLGGAGLARGYFGRPALTADLFRPDPFAGLHGEPGSRLYRTGDLARRRADGELEFLGRRDHQVKVRGIRVELEEVEAALVSCPGVVEAAVALREEGPGGPRLVAYVAPATVDLAGLRTLLRERLPAAMVPSSWVALDALPRNRNGKLDRRALPAPEAPAAGPAASRTPLEEAVAALWSELLGTGPAGAHDSFFDLGGHSLLATRLLGRVRQAFKVELSLRSFMEAPTVAAMAAAVEERASMAGRTPAIGRAARDGDLLPASFAQQRLWLAHRLAGGGAAYNMPLALRLEGRLDPAALAAAFTALAGRQESLRTTFHEVAGEPWQRIAPPAPVPLPWIDLGDLSAAAADAETARLAREAARLPFELSRGPLLRLALLRRGDRDHVLLIVLHHIVGDAWSMGILITELSELYRALLAKGSPRLADLPVQYADFAAWQRSWLSGPELERQLAYWRRSLADAPEALELPTDRPRPAVPTFRGVCRSAVVPAALVAELEALCRREGATPFMGLLAVTAVLLSRYANQDDLVIGSPIANRNRPEVEGLIGFFANTLALRTPVDGGSSWRELLARVRQVALDAYVHQDLPFEKLVDALDLRRSPGRSPLFQAMLSLDNTPPPTLALPGLRPERLEVDTGTAKFDLMLRARRSGDGLALEAEYAADLFDAATVDRLLTGFKTLLASLVADPAARLSEVVLASSAERRQGRERPAATLHGLLEERVRRDPDAVAVTCGGERLTFRELGRRSSRLAHLLLSRGVGLESRVGLCLPRSVDAVVAIFAILKAGGAYVPLDPAAPKRRLAYILSHAGVSLVVTREELRPALPNGRYRLVLLDREAGLGADATVEPPAPLAMPGNLAYILYTSGSTGSPKGVMIEHRSVVHLLAALRETVYADVDRPLRVALNAPLAFDASVKQWIQVLDGHALHVLPEDVRIDPPRLLATLAREEVDVLDCTPSQLVGLVAAGLFRGEGAGLDRVLVGGEEVTRALWAALEAGRRPRCFNVYGPTECTVDTTAAEVGAHPSRPTLGRPLPGVHVEVLDPWLNPVPPGVPGELVIGGAGVARGYLGRPDLTAERFIPDPWSSTPGARLYRSGDLARYLPDGTLEFLGRVDRQVKLRGFRIELGEIEAALAEHPAVSEAAAVVRQDGGDSRLAAYVSFRPEGAPPGAEELREHLRKRLPDYMVPAALVPLAGLPRTRNGKIDRAALPAPAAPTGLGPAEELPPLEEVLAGMMAEVLSLERVGPDDNFFELGGHSLRAIELISTVQSTFGVEIPLFHLFDSPTVAGLAAYLREDPERMERVEATAAILLQVTGVEPCEEARE